MNEHRGITENYEQIRNKYYFPNLKEKIQNFINNCALCKTTKYDRQPPNIEFQITETPKKPLEIIHTDILYLDNIAFLTILDKFSKHGTAYVLPDKTSKTIKSKLKNYIGIHGIPNKLIADNELNSNDMNELTTKYNIEFHKTTPYNSTGNSPVERFHSTLKELCTIVKSKNPEDEMHEIMETSIIAYNNSIHSATNMTPFMLLKGHYMDHPPEFGTEMEYAQQHKDAYKNLCINIHTKQLTKKEKIINKRNLKRKKPAKVMKDQVVYGRRIKRGKLTPPYRKQIVTKTSIGPILYTNKGKLHMNKIKNIPGHNQQTAKK